MHSSAACDRPLHRTRTKSFPEYGILQLINRILITLRAGYRQISATGIFNIRIAMEVEI